MTAVSEVTVATMIPLDNEWAQPVIPVVAGPDGWADIWDWARSRWRARDGQVLLQAVVETGGETAEPLFEVRLDPIKHRGILLGVLMSGGGTLAVLEQVAVANAEPQWAPLDIDPDGLTSALDAAGVQRGMQP